MIKLHPYGLFSVEDWTALYRKEHDERAKAVHDQLREADSWKSRSSRCAPVSPTVVRDSIVCR